MRILHLTLTKKWFDLIASGEKKEEYRSLSDYWCRRFLGKEWQRIHREIMEQNLFLYYDVIRFRNGYSPTAPTMEVEYLGMRVGEGKQEWGAEPGETYFVIKLGMILSIKNYNNGEGFMVAAN